jgi:hypothetical protein
VNAARVRRRLLECALATLVLAGWTPARAADAGAADAGSADARPDVGTGGAGGGAAKDAGGDGPAALPAPVVGPENAASALAYGTTVMSGNPSAACGTDRCLVAWDGYPSANAMMVDASGRPLRAASLRVDGTAGQHAVAYLGGSFVMTTSSGGDVTLLEIGPDGTPGTSVTLTLGTSIYDSALAWNGSRLMLVYRDSTSSTTDVLYSVPLAADLSAAGPSVMLATEAGVQTTLGFVAAGSAFVLMASQQLWSLGDDGHPTVGPVAAPAVTPSGFFALVAAGTVPVVLGSQSLYALGPNLQAQSTKAVGISAGAWSTGLGWNGTELLLATSTENSDTVGYQRYSASLSPLDAVEKLAPMAGSVYPLVVGVGGNFLIIAYKGYGYTPSTYGMTTFPVGADGSPGATAETLISVEALEQRYPLLAAQPSGFVVGVEEGLFQMGVLPLGADGKPAAGVAAADVVTYERSTPDAIGVGPNGGILVSGSLLDPRILNLRFDAAGHTLDNTPRELPASNTTMRGSVVWNGSAFLWLFGSELTPIATDGTFGTPMTFSGGTYAEVSRADALGTTTVVAWLDEVPHPVANTVQLRTIPLDATGTPLATAPADVGTEFPTVDPYPYTDHGLALGHDPGGFLVAWDQVTTETSGALGSELRVARLGPDGKPAQAGSTLLRQGTGAVPVGTAAAVAALSSPMVAFDGSVYWVTWREDGVRVRRVGTDGTALDPQPFKLIDEPFGDYAIASRGDGTLVIVYDRLDLSPDVQSERLQSRLITTSSQPGTGTGGSGGAADGGAGGAAGRGAGGTGGAAGGGAGGAAGRGAGGAGATGTGGAATAGGGGAGGVGTTGTGGASGAAGAAGRGTGGSGAATGTGAAAGTGSSGSGSAGCSCTLADGTNRSPAALALALALALASLVRRRARRFPAAAAGRPRQ